MSLFCVYYFISAFPLTPIIASIEHVVCTTLILIILNYCLNILLLLGFFFASIVYIFVNPILYRIMLIQLDIKILYIFTYVFLQINFQE